MTHGSYRPTRHHGVLTIARYAGKSHHGRPATHPTPPPSRRRRRPAPQNPAREGEARQRPPAQALQRDRLALAGEEQLAVARPLRPSLGADRVERSIVMARVVVEERDAADIGAPGEAERVAD